MSTSLLDGVQLLLMLLVLPLDLRLHVEATALEVVHLFILLFDSGLGLLEELV
jgi:hypothetical protein